MAVTVIITLEKYEALQRRVNELEAENNRLQIINRKLQKELDEKEEVELKTDKCVYLSLKGFCMWYETQCKNVEDASKCDEQFLFHASKS